MRAVAITAALLMGLATAPAALVAAPAPQARQEQSPALVAAPAPQARQEQSPAPVATNSGSIEGATKNGVTRFLGIPYAAPPVGNLRWMPPQAPAKWSGVKKAETFGPTCAQITTLGPFAGPPNANEDCLYLNVFTPDVKAKLPVLVWIHGGGYVDGESNDYDATKLAAKGRLVVVTINYRLNLFGFLSVPALDKEGHASGNYGLMDVQAALKWVKANIAGFGGNPGNVTLGGQSAGAGLAAANLVSPGGAGLFQRAILQSGGYTPFTPHAVAQAKGGKFAAAAGCDKSKDVAACLRALPAARIEALAGTASAMSPFIAGPMVDGTVVPRQTLETISAGAYNKVPVMIGTTKDEGNFTVGIAQYFRPGHAPTSAADFRGYVANAYRTYPKGSVNAVLARYPAKDSAQLA
jgi:para-nitrobenzyl esterase